jgi:competence protein ComGF
MGRLDGRNPESGWILLDVLVALLVVLIGFAIFLDALRIASSLTMRQGERVENLIGQRNENTKEHHDFLLKE